MLCAKKDSTYIFFVTGYYITLNTIMYDILVKKTNPLSLVVYDMGGLAANPPPRKRCFCGKAVLLEHLIPLLLELDGIQPFEKGADVKDGAPRIIAGERWREGCWVLVGEIAHGTLCSTGHEQEAGAKVTEGM